jgi:hypothetical protein
VTDWHGNTDEVGRIWRGVARMGVERRGRHGEDGQGTEWRVEDWCGRRGVESSGGDRSGLARR